MKNIEIGIDLGTTNSEVAVIQKGEIQIIANSFGDLYTPSVFGINKAKNIVIGKKAYEALNKFTSDDEIHNNKAEVKRLMGTNSEIYFPRIDRKYKPEEISAEILKSLKTDILSKFKNINTKGVVITVPAYFSTVQAEATKRAGEIAGFSKVILLQEPIAAAISYGFNNKTDENWLVYDLGGGTFDVALISSKNGDLRVLEHNGDNFLGGKDIDFAIIDTVIIPYLSQKFALKNFNRGNSDYRTIFQKLKYNVEMAKIQLSRLEKAEIECDFTIDGKEIFDIFVLTRELLEKAATPLVKKTIILCNETIKASGLDKKNIDKVILVGGPTQSPCIRQAIEHSLEIPVDTSADPLMAVAKGACIYAAGQQIEDDEENIDENVYQVNLFYESLSSETEELVVGEFPELKNSKKEYSIQIQNTTNTFNSDKIKLNEGRFKIYLPLEECKLNSFWIYLLDDKGNSLEISQDSFNITQGLSVSGAPLPKSIGLAFCEEDFITQEMKNIYEVVFTKNSILPISKTIHCKTAKTIRKGQNRENLGIYVYEGESKNIDRNTEICSLEVKGENIKQNIIMGADIEIKLSIDESRTLEIKAYFPDLNQEFDARSSLYDPDVTIEQLENEFTEIKDKFSKVGKSCNQEDLLVLEEDISETERDLQSAKLDEDDKYKVHSKLKKIKMLMDNMDQETDGDKEKQEFNNFLQHKEKIEKLCNEDELELLEELCRKGKEAQQNKDNHLLSIVNKEIDDIRRSLLLKDKNFLLALASELYQDKNLKDNYLAQKQFGAFIEAHKQNDIETMQQCLRILYSLLPQEKKAEYKLSGIKKI